MILFCTDFSPCADHAFTHALRIATLSPDTELHILHVIPEPPAQFWKTYLYDMDTDVDTQAKREIDAKFAASYLPRIPETLPHKLVVRIGDASQQILSYAAETHPSLIVMGRQGSSRLFGNTASLLARKSPSPLLLVPPPAT